MALTDISHPTDIAMLTDLYELTMAQGLWESDKANEQGCFTAFYRDHPFAAPTPSCAAPPSARACREPALYARGHRLSSFAPGSGWRRDV